MQAAAIFILENFCLMGMETYNSESYMGTWPEANIDVLDTDHEGRSLEEELERIIKLADKISEKAQSTAETLLEFEADKKQKGKRNAKKSALASLMFGRSRTSLRSDKSSIRQPRLSPLAARAALAATVTPLGQSSQAGFSGKPQGLNLQPTAGNGGPSTLKLKKKESRVKKGKSAAVPVRRGHQASLAHEKIVELRVRETGSLPLDQYYQDIQLIVDIPIYKENYIEKAMNLTIDVPFLER